MRFKVILATLKELKKDNCIQEKTSKTIIQELAVGTWYIPIDMSSFYTFPCEDTFFMIQV